MYTLLCVHVSMKKGGVAQLCVHNYSLCLRKSPNLTFISDHKVYLGDVQSLKY